MVNFRHGELAPTLNYLCCGEESVCRAQDPKEGANSPRARDMDKQGESLLLLLLLQPSADPQTI